MGESLIASGHLTYSQEYLKHKEALDYWKAWVLKDKVKVSHIQLFVTPSSMQSMKFSRPKYWSG